MDVRMAAALSGAVPNVAAFCRAQGISRETFYKWRARFREGGVEGLVERSRRPRHPGGLTAAGVEDEVVRVRKALADDGADHGPDSIRAGWLDAGLVCPSRATIARILTRRGLVVPAPNKRPRSATRRFVYPRPNECWQSDWTHYRLLDGQSVAIAGTLDDHSRMLVGLAAGPGDANAELVWSVMLAAISVYGIPQRSLTDNGLVYSGARRNVVVPFETNLRALGCHPICSTPHHPQTCGKIERHWQTLKRWLNAHGPYPTLTGLQADLEVYQTYYNQRRPHRALHGLTPAAAFTSTVKARPAERPLPAPTQITRVKVQRNGVANLGEDIQLGLGTTWAATTIDVIRDNDHLAAFAGPHLIGAIKINHTHRYHRLPRQPYLPSAMS